MIWSSRVIAGAVLVAVGIGWLLQTSGIVHFDGGVIAPIVLIAIGVALVLGSRSGLHVPLLVAGIVLAVIIGGNNASRRHGNPADFRGVTTETPMSAAELGPYRIGAGDLTVDLLELPLNGTTYRVSAHAGTGRLFVLVPSGTDDVVDARTGVGSSDVFGRHASGANTHIAVFNSYPGRTKFIIDASVGAGVIKVSHGRESRRA